MKKTPLYLVVGLLMSLLIPTHIAFAQEAETTDESSDFGTVDINIEDSVEEISCIEPGCGIGGGGYYYNGIYFNIWTTVEMEANGATFYGTYEVFDLKNKDAVLNALQEAYINLNNAIEFHGDLTRNGLYTYPSWNNTNLYSGSLSVTFDLNNLDSYRKVENIFYEKGFSPWVDVKVDNLIDAESAAAGTLAALIGQKKAIYEQILGYELGMIDSLYIYSWTDGSTYNPKTKMVNVTVNADVTYYTE